MPTKEQILVEKRNGPISGRGGLVQSGPDDTVAVNRTTDDDSDEELGDRIYKSSRTAKARAEAATTAASNALATRASEQFAPLNKTSRGTQVASTSKKCSVLSKKGALKRTLPEVKDDGSIPPKKAPKRWCSRDGCTNGVIKGGVCIRHGAARPRHICNYEGCIKHAQKGGVCWKHGAKHLVAQSKRCNHDGCTNQRQKGGFCTRHGAQFKNCSHKGCTDQAKKGGVCRRHGQS